MLIDINTGAIRRKLTSGTGAGVRRIFSSDIERGLQFIWSAPVPTKADLTPFAQFNG